MREDQPKPEEADFDKVLKGLTARIGVPLIELPGFVDLSKRFKQTIAEDLKNALAFEQPMEVICEAEMAADRFISAPQEYCRALIEAERWSAAMPVLISKGLLVNIVNSGLGGAPFDAASKETGLTPIEAEIGSTLIDLIAASLTSVFAPVDAVTFEKIWFDEATWPADSLAVADTWIAIQLASNSAGEPGAIIALPLSALQGLRDRFGAPLEEASAAGMLLDDRASGQLSATEITLGAYLDGGRHLLDNLTRLSAGAVLPMETTSQSLIEVRCGDHPVLLCRLGQHRGRFSLKVDSFIDPEANLMNDLLASAADDHVTFAGTGEPAI